LSKKREKRRKEEIKGSEKDERRAASTEAFSMSRSWFVGFVTGLSVR
jgi:hypothetical protein